MKPLSKALCRVITTILQGLETQIPQREFYDAMVLLNEHIVSWLIWKKWKGPQHD